MGPILMTLWGPFGDSFGASEHPGEPQKFSGHPFKFAQLFLDLGVSKGVYKVPQWDPKRSKILQDAPTGAQQGPSEASNAIVSFTLKLF